MTRIATFGSNQLYLSRITELQQRMQKEQLQVSTGLKSLDYSGIAADANRMINMSNESSAAAQFIKTNTVADAKIDAASTAVEGVTDTISEFKKRLSTFRSGNSKLQGNVEDVQEWAYRALVDMRAFLSTKVDGQYLFSGGRTNTEPVQLPTDSLSEFQDIFDGYTRKVPTTRSPNLTDLHLTATDTGDVSFTAATGLIKPVNAKAFNKIPTDTLVKFTNTTSNNANFNVRHAVTNRAGDALGEGTAAAASFITYSDTSVSPSTVTSILNAASGNLAVAFNPDGTMSMTPGTANTLSAMAEGTKFTVSGSTAGNYDGAYVVTANSNGVVSFKNDVDICKVETIDTGDLTLRHDTADAGTDPDSVAGLTLGSGNATFTISGSTVTLNLPAGTTLPAAYIVGATFDIAGTTDHNGAYVLTGVTSGATGATLSFAANPDVLRVSKLLPQTGRNDVTLTYEDGNAAFDNQDYGSLSFSPNGTGGETITAATAGAFLINNIAVPAVGATFTLSSTSGVNDGTYQVVSNDGTTIEVAAARLTDELPAVDAKVDCDSWYQGDTLTLQNRIDTGRSLDFTVYASDPAFEKAMRAMFIIAQGTFGTAGGLENNQERISAAMYLLGDAEESPAAGTAPYGTEMRSDINSVQSKLGVAKYTLSLTNDKHLQFQGFLDQRVIDISHMEKTEAITRLLGDSRALEASYQSLAQIRQLSLLNYLN
jgi:flagellin-like hook-associated protein FlgL